MKTVESMKKIIWKTSMALFLVLLLFVFYYSMQDWNGAPFFMEKFSGLERMFITLLGISFLCFIFLSIKRHVWEKEEKQLKKAAIILLFVYALLQLAYLCAMKVGLRYDALKTLDEAVSTCRTGQVSPVHLDGYFARYTNNYPILFLTIVLLKLFEFLNIAGEQYGNAVTLLGIVNIAMIDMGIFFTWKLVGKIKGQKAAFLSLLFAVCNPVFLLWTPFYYTNTVSMGLLMAGIYGSWLLFEDENSSPKKGKDWLTACLCGMALWVGFSIRATVFITVIALMAYFLLKKAQKKQKLMAKLFFLLVGVLFAALAGKAAEKKYISFDTKDTAFPPIHWIAMGAGGQGVYNIVDEYYTMGFETKEEKIEGDLELFKERIRQLGAAGYGRLMLDKLRLTWADGSGGYLSELGVSQSYLPVHKYFLGGKADFLGLYGAVFYSFSLFLTAVSAFLSMRKEDIDFFYIACLNLLGGFLFHMLWEAGTIYSIGFMVLLPLSMTEGFEYVHEAISKKSGNRAFYFWIAPAAALLLLFLVKGRVFFRQDYITNEATVNQFLYQCDESGLLLENELYVQTFVGDKCFNRLGIQLKNGLGESNLATYQIRLLDYKMNVLAEQEITGSEITGYQFVTLSFDTIDGKQAEGCFYVIVEKTGGNQQEGLTFLSYDTGNYDAYKGGKLAVIRGMTAQEFMEEGAEALPEEGMGSEASLFRDLAFCVYQQEKAPYFGEK